MRGANDSPSRLFTPPIPHPNDDSIKPSNATRLSFAAAADVHFIYAAYANWTEEIARVRC